MTQKIAGVVPPLVTPFTEDEELDLEALRAEIRYMVDVAGVHGIAIGGSSRATIRRSIAFARRCGRIAVPATTMFTSIDAAI